MNIASLHPWYYPVEINGMQVTPGVGSPHSASELMARTAYRRDILVDQVLERRSFVGESLLDVGCNCGYWSSLYAAAGASSFVGVEGRDIFVNQGRLLWSSQKELHDCQHRFVVGDVMAGGVWADIAKDAPYDFCLCAGIMYHVSDPLWLLQQILSVTRHAVLIDTRVAEAGHKKSKVFREKGDWKFDAIPGNRMACHPTLAGLSDALMDADFSVERIVSRLPLPKEMQGNDNYDAGRRVTLLASKRV